MLHRWVHERTQKIEARFGRTIAGPSSGSSESFQAQVESSRTFYAEVRTLTLVKVACGPGEAGLQKKKLEKA